MLDHDRSEGWSSRSVRERNRDREIDEVGTSRSRGLKPPSNWATAWHHDRYLRSCGLKRASCGCRGSATRRRDRRVRSRGLKQTNEGDKGPI